MEFGWGERTWGGGRPDRCGRNGTAAVRGKYAQGLRQWQWNKQLDGFIIDCGPRSSGLGSEIDEDHYLCTAPLHGPDRLLSLASQRWCPLALSYSSVALATKNTTN